MVLGADTKAVLLYSFATLQFADPARGTHASMVALIVAEIGGFTVLLAGFVDGQIL